MAMPRSAMVGHASLSEALINDPSDFRHLAKFLHCVHTAHAEAGMLTQEYLSPV